MNPRAASVIHARCFVPLLGLLLVGCSVTGLGGSDQYGCKAPEGVHCESVSGTYANATQNNLPTQRRSSLGASPAAVSRDPRAQESAAAADGRIDASLQPLRSEPRILRLWFKAYLDSDQDLNDQGYVFVQIDAGRWVIEQTQRQTRAAFAPIRPPRAASSSNAEDPRSPAARGAASLGDPLRSPPSPQSVSGAAARAKSQERP